MQENNQLLGLFVPGAASNATSSKACVSTADRRGPDLDLVGLLWCVSTARTTVQLSFWFLVLHFFCCLLKRGSNVDTTRCRSLINVDLSCNSRSNPVKCGHRVTCCCWVLDALFKSGLLQSGSNISTSGLRYAAHHHGNKRPSEFMSQSQRTDLTTTFLPMTVRLCRVYTSVLGFFFPPSFRD